MTRDHSLRARGFSIGTKLILITLLIETSTVVGGTVLAYAFLAETRISHFKQILFSQLDLIEQEIDLEKTHPSNAVMKIKKLDFENTGDYQVVDQDGLVIWDSRNTKRIGSQIMSQHALFSIAKKSVLKQGTPDYQISQTGQQFLGAYRLVGNHYYILGAISKDEIQRDIVRTLERFFYVALLMYGLSFFVIVLFTRQIITPVQSLTNAALKIAQGDFNIELERPSRDEIGLLSETFAQMTQRIRILLEDEDQKIRIEQEVGNVAELQQLLLPPPFIDSNRYQIASYYQSATETGGDFWGYFETPDHLIIYVGDATGHGLPSAMMTAAARGCFSSLQRFYSLQPQQAPSLELFLEYANQAVLDVSQGQLQMTLFVAMISFKEKKLSFANAGHQAGMILRGRASQIDTLFSKGMRLGENVTYVSEPAKTVDFDESDTLFIYSDGLTDLRDKNEKTLGKLKLKRALSECLTQRSGVLEMREKIKLLASTYSPNDLPEDDITFAFMRLRS